MRIVKLIVISFAILFLLTTAIGMLFPSTVRITRAVDVTAQYDTVYKYLNDAKYWKLWMAGTDSNTISFLSAKTAGRGTVVKIGTGEVTITRTTTDSIFSIWKSAGGNVQNAAFILLNNPAKNLVTVQWYFEQHVNWYPWERLSSLSNDKILGPVIEESLNKLKTVLNGK